mgnify:CR=1 FL=1
MDLTDAETGQAFTHAPWLYAGLVAPYSVTENPTY